MSRLTTALLALVILCVCFSHAVNPIDIRGQQFVNSESNERFMVVGVDYQPGGQGGYKPQDGEDALANATVCLRDAALLQELGVNTIRVYNVGPDINHDECASIFNLAGIYMIIDVNAPFSGESLDRSNPSGSYTADYLERTFGVVEAFKDYPNTLAFFAANEVMNDESNVKENPQYIRAIQRDLKQYIAQNADRQIPVGYSAADVRPILRDTWQYFQCAIDGDADADLTRSDFFGLNSYSWCSESDTFEDGSTYDELAAMFQSSSVPVIFSEYGCNEIRPRQFNEVPVLYGEQMTMLSGGLVYEFSEEKSNFGLVTINDNGTVSLGAEFTYLQEQYNDLDLDLLQSTNSSAQDIEPPRCSSSLIENDGFSTEFDIPETPDRAVNMIRNGISNPPQGRIVDISSLTVPMPVYAVDGSELEGLSVTRVSGSNTPGGDSINGTSTGDGSTGSTRPSDGAAMMLAPDVYALGVGALLAGMLGWW